MMRVVYTGAASFFDNVKTVLLTTSVYLSRPNSWKMMPAY